jgi:predicted O-methyltransferase YrrM
MKFDEIYSIVGSVPFISKENGRFLYDLILRERLTNILELGIAHGTATCYMAAALQELGQGSITSVDLIEVQNYFKPSAEELLVKAGLSSFVNVIRMQTGYTWFLHDEIARNTEDNVCNEIYDLCVIDGPKNWTIDGAAFFFADKLLRKNGWLIFDDYNWSYASADVKRDSTDGITHRSLSEDEREIPHIREVFELLVKQHPHYGNLLILDDSDWALAQKTMDSNKTYRVVYRESPTVILAKVISKAYRRLSRMKKGQETAVPGS